MTRAEFFNELHSRHEGDLSAQRAMLGKLAAIVFDNYFTLGGTKSAAQLTAMDTPDKNKIYRIGTGGDLNEGGGDAITVAARDMVYHNGTIWALFADVDA